MTPAQWLLVQAPSTQMHGSFIYCTHHRTTHDTRHPHHTTRDTPLQRGGVWCCPLAASSSGRWCGGGRSGVIRIYLYTYIAHGTRLHRGGGGKTKACAHLEDATGEKMRRRKREEEVEPVATGPSSSVVAVARAWSSLASSGACTRWAPPCWARCCSSPGSSRGPARWCGRWFGSRVAPWGRRPSSRT